MRLGLKDCLTEMIMNVFYIRSELPKYTVLIVMHNKLTLLVLYLLPLCVTCCYSVYYASIS